MLRHSANANQEAKLQQGSLMEPMLRISMGGSDVCTTFARNGALPNSTGLTRRGLITGNFVWTFAAGAGSGMSTEEVPIAAMIPQKRQAGIRELRPGRCSGETPERPCRF